MKLNEMNVVVTGANGAVATGLIKHFSKKASFVAGTVRHLSKNLENNKNFTLIEMDPLDVFSIERAILWIKNKAGNIHVWMNIVGGFTAGSSVEEGGGDWNYMYNTNFMTALNCCQIILPKMKQQGCGRIINIGARSAEKGMPLAGPYCVSKVAVHILTKIIALENGGNITCNAILPGIINTETNRKQMPGENHEDWTKIGAIACRAEALLLSKENGALVSL